MSTPLMLTMLSLQAIVLLLPTPATLSVAPGGALETVTAVVDGAVVGGIAGIAVKDD
ncbi:MAG: hypothetical protein WCI78_16320 [Mycobacterium sp.]